MTAPLVKHSRMLVAGTFDVLHEGHYNLLHTSFLFGKHVEIWISDDKMVEQKMKKTNQVLQPFSVRSDNVKRWCESQTEDSIKKFVTLNYSSLPLSEVVWTYKNRYSIHALSDAYGPSVSDPSYTAITCSEETFLGCELINKKRAELGFSPLEIFVTPVVLDDDGDKLSSTKLRAAAVS